MIEVKVSGNPSGLQYKVVGPTGFVVAIYDNYEPSDQEVRQIVADHEGAKAASAPIIRRRAGIPTTRW